MITYCNNNCNVAYAWGLMLSWMLVFVEKCIGSHLQCFAIGATQTPTKATTNTNTDDDDKPTRPSTRRA